LGRNLESDLDQALSYFDEPKSIIKQRSSTKKLRIYKSTINNSVKSCISKSNIFVSNHLGVMKYQNTPKIASPGVSMLISSSAKKKERMQNVTTGGSSLNRYRIYPDEKSNMNVITHLGFEDDPYKAHLTPSSKVVVKWNNDKYTSSKQSFDIRVPDLGKNSSGKKRRKTKRTTKIGNSRTNAQSYLCQTASSLRRRNSRCYINKGKNGI
jgi:hypothetical protein